MNDNGDPSFPYPRYLTVPFIFIPDGAPASPELAAFKAANPGWVTFRATLTLRGDDILEVEPADWAEPELSGTSPPSGYSDVDYATPMPASPSCPGPSPYGISKAEAQAKFEAACWAAHDQAAASAPDAQHEKSPYDPASTAEADRADRAQEQSQAARQAVLAAPRGDVRVAHFSAKTTDGTGGKPEQKQPTSDPVGRPSTPTETADDLRDGPDTLSGNSLVGNRDDSDGPVPFIRLASFYTVSSPAAEYSDTYVLPAAGTKDPLQPDPRATGPHSTFRRAPDGSVHNYETYERNDRVKNKDGTDKYDPVLRYRGIGKPHNTVDTPYVIERRAGKGPGSTPGKARPALPHEIPRSIVPDQTPPPAKPILPETDILDDLIL